MTTELDLEIQSNLKAFQAQSDKLRKCHRGRYALLRHEEIVAIYDTVRDAQITGSKFFDDGLYSVQKIGMSPINLGSFSYAVHLADSQ